MKHVAFGVLLFIILSSCGDRTNKSDTHEKEPKALETKQSSSFLSSGSGRRGNLVDALYEELEAKTPELQGLRKEIEDIDGRKADSLSAYNSYIDKSFSYYSSANENANGIGDSLLKEKIKSLIAASEYRYKKNTLKLTELDSLLINKENSLQNYFTILKIVKTLPLIEKYQQNKKPTAKSIEEIIKSYDSLINKTKKISG